ncbi:hypothetical protein, partial [[Eubacterium] cellulosolvens]
MKISIESSEKKVLDYIEDHSDEVVNFVRGIIKFKTLNPEKAGDPIYESNECQKFIQKELDRAGLESELYEPDIELFEKKYKGTPNYIANRVFGLKGRPQLWSRLRGTGGGKSM